VRGLEKRYGAVAALGGVDLTVNAGDVYGFLGRNGAGKSTTIRVLMGITRPSGGVVRMFGDERTGDRVRLRQRIGYVAQEQNFYPWMSADDLGRFVGGLFPTWEAAAYARLLRALDVPPARKVRELSGGTRVKLALALALAHRPELLLLDEPTAGLDPVARREFLDILRDQSARDGTTTLFSTHLIDEIELAAGRVGILDGGRTRFEGTLAELSRRVRRLRRALHEATFLDANGALQPVPLPPPLDDARVARVLDDRPASSARGLPPDERHVTLELSPGADGDPLAEARRGGWAVDDLALEEIFVALVRRRAAV
jgi:ABC-2 type transport system ATP-binding protein